MSVVPDPRMNRLIRALPQADLSRWRPQLEWVDLPLGKVLHEPGLSLNHVYFPTDAIVSLLYLTQCGSSTEQAVVGHDGFVGIPLILGGGTTLHRAVVQSAGQGFRLKAQAIQDEFRRSFVVKQLLLRYTQALLTQMAQTAVCNRHHTLEQQVSRRLLQSLDRLAGSDIVMTQELISNMLGVRREGVTEAAVKLQREGLISYSRGHIKVINRLELESRSCECYAVVKNEYDRLMPPMLESLAMEPGQEMGPRLQHV